MKTKLFALVVIATFVPFSGLTRAESKLVVELRAGLSRDPRATVDALNYPDMEKLLELHEYAAVEEFAIKGTLAVAADPARIEQLQKHRVKALLAEGRADDALRAAKGLFNVCTMHFVKEALALLCDCLKATHANDPSYVPKFKAQVLANAQEDPAERTRQANQYGGNSIMAGIPGDPKPYTRAIAELRDKTDYASLCASANLLLLSGHVTEATDRLNKAYAAAPADDLNAASEGIARRIKADDGAIGRANQFVRSLRPTE